MSGLDYTPAGSPPSQLQDLTAFVYTELQRISDSMRVVDLIHLETTGTAPSKASDGDIRFADGTGWNPDGGGAGVFVYYGGSWRRMA